MSSEIIIELTRHERKDLRDAIISAYPDIDKLEIMVDEELDEKLNKIAKLENIEKAVFDLINWAKAQGKLKQLIDAACQGNPGNPYLKNVTNLILWKRQIKEILYEITAEEKFKYIKKAYKYCAPPDWPKSPSEVNNLEEIIEQISQMSKGNHRYTKLQIFVIFLIEDFKLEESIISNLKEWAEINIGEFSELWERIKTDLNQQRKNKKSYLLVLIKNTRNSSLYSVLGWIIPDFNSYNHKNGKGCKPLYASGDSEKTFKIDDIPQIIENFLDESNNDEITDLTIEIFLPLDLLKHDVDNWEVDRKSSFPWRIGKHYKVVIRSCERLADTYRSKIFWRQKWKQLGFLKRTSILDVFYLGNDDNLKNIADLKSKENIIGLKVPTAPKKVGEGSIFDAIISSAIPVALWVRKDFKDCELKINNILNCDINKWQQALQEAQKISDDTYRLRALALLAVLMQQTKQAKEYYQQLLDQHVPLKNWLNARTYLKLIMKLFSSRNDIQELYDWLEEKFT